ncbi:S-layer homology domain-containing protein [Paenibacillus alvei]|uniref:polysaccharide lyase family 8 super-sandwich domain-containing protein n=1 Tax=Paenibacillus alvei TaxID=44250 RepID=UPI00028A3FEC|nr:polysaccharide lyase family 8 super-sandwich domain-containing protein [Paenibacillus alvei]EJW17743.1 hyaluronate lyase [Paenibacillus alvei DSM 29]MCY9543123.1 S-layer homology domain-containing protein [Paenibacillus alvei]MCY9707258.1 S-layer homology domain-containing protein [Paenibacillus alvei]MCY9733683.1 S-layer homology domain-containing protein [Paenibacillus alvei]MCY9755414.1 S-layer homology domain-containing protein [Paenibacillus alvei]
MKRILSLLLVVTIVVTFLPVSTGIAMSSHVDNLFPNGDFESTVAPSGTWTQYTDTNPAPVNWDTWIPVGSGKPTGRTVSVTVATYDSYSGQQSMLIDASGTSRVSINAKAPVESGKSYRLQVWYKTENIAGGNGAYFRTSVLNASNTKLIDGPTSTKVYGTNDWTMQQVFITVPAGGAKFFVELFLENCTGKVWFDNIRLEEYDGITGLTLEPTATTMTVGDVKPLTLTVTPNNLPSPKVIWSTSDENVATVDQDGNVTAVAAGVATITVATDDQMLKAQSTIGVDSTETAAAYNQLRERWKQKLVGVVDDNLASDPAILALVAEMDNSVSNAAQTGYLDTLSANDGSRRYLWSDLVDNADTKVQHANNIVSEFTRIKIMANAYNTKNSNYYHNSQLRDAIIGALDWMYAKRYNERLSYSSASSWWGFEIGAPQLLNDCLILMYDELNDQQIGNFMRTIDKYCPNPTMRVQNSSVIETGGNLLDKALVVTLRGVIGKNSAKITQGRDSIGSEFTYVTKGDGVYEDGSLVQHANIAYTAGYGAVWLSRTADITYLLNTSPWPVTDPRVANIYKWVSDTFEPVIYKGLYMDMVNGRGISRRDSGTARSTIVALASLAEGAPPQISATIRSMVKEWVSKDTTFDDYYKGLPIYSVMLLKKVMNDDTVAPRGELSRSYMFNGMARVAHHRPNYAFGLSMFSDRISAFEMGNKENVKGWDTGLGMTYIYNEDLLQYRDGFWATVNSFRLPGTTTDGSGEGKMPGEWAYYYNTKSHVGGATLDHLYSASGMDFSLTKVTGSDLSGKKSWFMFDDEIVALGTDIRKTSAATKTVETIVDNRKLNSSGDNAFVINGVQVPAALDYAADINDVNWAHLAGNGAGSGADMGYYFPTAPTLHVVREARTGSWYDINNGQSQDKLTRNYASIAFDHGNNPQAASYEYVLLPGKTTAQTQAYSEQPTVEVLSNTSTVQAVSNKPLGITAANFWSADTVGSIHVKSAAAVIMKEDSGEMTIAISDPTQKQNTVTIEVHQPNLTLLTADTGMKVTPIQDGVSIEVNTSGSLGKTYTATFDLGKSYTVTAEGATADKQTAKKGETVTVTLDTPVGKSFDKWIVTPTSLTLTQDSTNTNMYAFIMPDEAVKVTATYKDTTPVDNTSPTWPTGAQLLASSVGKTSLLLSWTAATDDTGVISYKIYKDGIEYIQLPDTITSYIVSGLSPNKSYIFEVKAGDATEKWSDGLRVTVRTEADSSGGGSTPSPGPTTPIPDPTPTPEPTDPIEPTDPETPKVDLSDIADHWAKASIEKSVELGFVSGYEDGTFRPNRSITRGEISAMLARALKLEKVNTAFGFADQSQTPVWAQPFIQALAKAGYISGYENGTFRANKEITRSELVVMIVRARGLEVHPNATLTFTDADQVPAWAKPYVATAEEAGLIKGYGDGKFNPNASTTRAEAVTLILGMLNDLK